MAFYLLLEHQPAAEFLELEDGGYLSFERSGQLLLEQPPWHLEMESSFFELG